MTPLDAYPWVTFALSILVTGLFGAHMAMHQAVKAMCENVLAGSPALEPA